MDRQQLIINIKQAFEGVKLEDGVGLWEGQGLDDYASLEKLQKLRSKDERNNWWKIPLEDFDTCESSLSFFDAKGMRFHLPMLLLLNLEYFDEERNEIIAAPDIEFSLISILKYLNDNTDVGKKMRDYHIERFSLLTTKQRECVIDFLKYQLKKMEGDQDMYWNKMDPRYLQLQEGLKYWESKKNSSETD